MTKRITAGKIKHYELNLMIKDSLKKHKEIILEEVSGQRYIGDGLKGKFKIEINGTPGNDLGAFMDGPSIEVFGNGQDGIGNTMNTGKIVIHGDCGDILGYSMRGGRIFIKGDVGYRAGIHMKSFNEKRPVLIIGGSAGNFLGEYMAGGIIIILGQKNQKHPLYQRDIVGNYVGTGMHGGIIYIKEDIEEYKLGKEVKKEKVSNEDVTIIKKHILDFYRLFGIDKHDIEQEKFYKLIPHSHRPYGKLYTY